ncbi:MAG: M48 family metallopeptidase [Chloroflexi bacterium]|nr:M48 family metallopeptidase [Chloroflexota bacterium]
MQTQIKVGGVSVDVVFKNIKNVHLSVHPPTGRVRISAPARMKLDTLRVYAISKLDWITKHQKRLQSQERETRREYIDRESHFVWGRRCLLKVVEHESVQGVELAHSTMILRVRSGADQIKKEALVAEWYRQQLKAAVQPLIAKWEPLMGVKVARVYVRHMKTRWGSCSPGAGSIRLNSELAKKPRECLEYIVVHEMAHLLEPSHNARFIGLMDRFLPMWRSHRDVLNCLPVRHEHWSY